MDKQYMETIKEEHNAAEHNAAEHTAAEYISLYIEQMSPQEKLVLKIAIEHLESSFDIEKSIGFKEWRKNMT